MKGPAISIGAAPLAAQDLVDRHVAASGTFLPARTVLLDNRNRRGRPGYEVVTPLALSPTSAVLVQRGWIERARGGEVRTPGGAQTIDGFALAHLPRVLSAGGEEKGPIRQNLDIGAYAAEIGMALQPVIIQQRNDDGDGLVRDWPRADLGVDMHRAYAVQWYALAGLCVALGLVFSFRRVAQS
jgi:surfeit locus 1 family protein